MEEYYQEEEFEGYEEWDGISQPTENMFDDYSDFARAQTQYEVRQTLAPVLPPPPQPSPFPDNEQAAERQKAVNWFAECRAKAVQARTLGNHDEALTWEQRAQWGVKDLENLGASYAERLMQAAGEQEISEIVKTLFLDDLADDPDFDHPKVQHDSAVMVIQANKRGIDGWITLPKESAAWGDTLAVKPRNMMRLQLNESEFARWKSMVFDRGGSDSSANIFRRSWAALRQLGYAHMAQPAFEEEEKPEPKPKKREKSKAPYIKSLASVMEGHRAR